MSIRKEVNNEKLKFLYSKKKRSLLNFVKQKKENYEYGTYKTIRLQRLPYRLLLY